MVNYVIAIDIDGVLRSYKSDKDIIPNERIRHLAVILHSFKNVKVVAWSGQGGIYAAQVVRELGLGHYIRDCYTKGDIEPDIAIDDQHEFSLGKMNLIVREVEPRPKAEDSGWVLNK